MGCSMAPAIWQKQVRKDAAKQREMRVGATYINYLPILRASHPCGLEMPVLQVIMDDLSGTAAHSYLKGKQGGCYLW